MYNLLNFIFPLIYLIFFFFFVTLSYGENYYLNEKLLTGIKWREVYIILSLQKRAII